MERVARLVSIDLRRPHPSQVEAPLHDQVLCVSPRVYYDGVAIHRGVDCRLDLGEVGIGVVAQVVVHVPDDGLPERREAAY